MPGKRFPRVGRRKRSVTIKFMTVLAELAHVETHHHVQLILNRVALNCTGLLLGEVFFFFNKYRTGL